MRKVYLIKRTFYNEDGSIALSEVVCALSSQKALDKAMESTHEVNVVRWKVTKKDMNDCYEYQRVDTGGHKLKMEMRPIIMYICGENDF